MGLHGNHLSKDKGKSIYTPPPKAMKLIEVMLDPVHRLSHVSRICEIAGISRKYYYLCFNDERFTKFYQQAALNALKQYSGQLINIGIREARKGGSGGVQYWKTLLEMAELHSTKVQVQETSDKTIRIVFGSENDDDEDTASIEEDGNIIEIGGDSFVFGEDSDEE